MGPVMDNFFEPKDEREAALVNHHILLSVKKTVDKIESTVSNQADRLREAENKLNRLEGGLVTLRYAIAAAGVVVTVANLALNLALKFLGTA